MSAGKVLILLGTRPETIKLATVALELERQNLDSIIVSSGQHADLINPFVELFGLEINHDLQTMSHGQTSNEVCARILTAFDRILELEKPDLVVVQGDTTTALAGALCGFNRQIPIAHVEAGLRSGNAQSPFPEEMNRRLISQLATLHFAATEFNRESLLAENVNPAQIFVTGNPVIDALEFVLKNAEPSGQIIQIIEQTRNLKTVLLTTHRRESFGAAMRENLFALRDFVEAHKDTAIIFPVHPNPAVKSAAKAIFQSHERVFLQAPLGYADFVQLMRHAWLIVSDSGGVQEEAAALGKPLLVIRENTERPEAVSAGVAKIVGKNPARLRQLLEENYLDETWIKSVTKIKNPFGDGAAAGKIVKHITSFLHSTAISK